MCSPAVSTTPCGTWTADGTLVRMGVARGLAHLRPDGCLVGTEPHRRLRAGVDNAVGPRRGPDRWSNWYSFGGGLIGDPDVSSWGPDRLDVFVRGLDNGLWHRALSAAGWSSWQTLGGSLTSGPGSASWGANRIDVFARRRWVGVGDRVDGVDVGSLVFARRPRRFRSGRRFARREQAERRQPRPGRLALAGLLERLGLVGLVHPRRTGLSQPDYRRRTRA